MFRAWCIGFPWSSLNHFFSHAKHFQIAVNADYIPVVGRASVTQEPGSPTVSLLEPSTSNQNKRSSSRSSRRSTRLPDLHLSNSSNPSNTSSKPSRSSYSLPTTPIHSSFEETLLSTKRRQRRGSVSYEDNKSINLSESKDLSSGLANSFDPSQKSDLNQNSHSDKLSTESQAPQSSSQKNQTPGSHLDKLSKEAQASQSTSPSQNTSSFQKNQVQDPHFDKLSKEAQAFQSTDIQKNNHNQNFNSDKLSTEAQASHPTDTQKSNRRRNPSSDRLSTEAQTSQPTDTQKSDRKQKSRSEKLSHEAQTSQSTLHSFLLKKPQDRRKSLASQADVTDSNQSDSNTSTNDSSLSGKRRTRKSMPAKMNGSSNQDYKRQHTASSSRASTPQSIKADRKSKKSTRKSGNTATIMPHIPVESTPTVSSAAKVGRDKPVTPAPSRGFTPINSSSTRRTRQSVADLANQMHGPSTPPGDAMDIDSHPPVIESSVKDSSRATKRPMSNTITLNVGRKALESVLPAALDTTRPSYDHEIAESVESTPLHVYEESFGDNYHFDYTADMYGHNFGLDGQVDGPTSPTSFATSTSTGARTSGRTRKPTIRAMESMESERRFRRKRTRTPAAKEEPTTNGNGVGLPHANANAIESLDQEDAHQDKRRKKTHATDADSASVTSAPAPTHPTPAPSTVAHSIVPPSVPIYPPSIHSAPARPASTASSPNRPAMAPYVPNPPAPATNTPAPYAAMATPTQLSTDRVDVVMRLISVADDALVAHPDADEPEDDKFLEEMRRAFQQTHDLTSSGNLSSSGNPVEPLPCETKPVPKAKPTRPRAGKGKSRRGKARRGKPAGGAKKVLEESKGVNRQTNEFGEEVVVVSSGYHWYRPNNTYGDGGLPQPPLRLKSDEQAEKDRIFGFPPRMGERNLPRAFSAPFAVENVDEERAKIRAREEARLRRIPVDRHMSTADIQQLIRDHDSAGAPNPLNDKATRSSRKRRHVEGFGAPAESPKRRSRVGGGNSENQVGPEPATTPSGPARPNLILKMPRPAAHEAKKRPSEASGRPGKANKRQKVHQEASGGEGQGQPSEPTRLTLSFKNKKQPKLKLRQPATPKQPDTSEGVAEEAATPENPPLTSPGHGSSSRPRRRAAAALMAEFENHAQERARRANARKKRAEGTPEEAH